MIERTFKTYILMLYACEFQCAICVLFLFFVFIVGQVRVPKQLVVVGDSSCIPNSVAEAGLKLPLGKLPFRSRQIVLSTS